MRKRLLEALLAGGSLLGVGLYGPTLLPGTNQVGTERGVVPGDTGGRATIGIGNADGRPRPPMHNHAGTETNSQTPFDDGGGDLGAGPDGLDPLLGPDSRAGGSLGR